MLKNPDTFIASKLPNVLQPGAQRIKEGFKDKFFGRFSNGVDRLRAQGWVNNLVIQTTDKLSLIITDFHLDDNELESVKISFEQSLNAANDIFTPDIWLELKLSRHDIEKHIREKAPENITTGLSDSGVRLYQRLISDSAFLAVELIPLLPNFVQKTIPSVLQEQGALREDIDTLKADNDELKNSMEAVEERLLEYEAIYRQSKRNTVTEDQDFEENYRRELADALDYPDLFGLDVHAASKRYHLSTAYISLQVSYAMRQPDDDLLMRIRELNERGQFDEMEGVMREGLADRVRRVGSIT